MVKTTKLALYTGVDVHGTPVSTSAASYAADETYLERSVALNPWQGCHKPRHSAESPILDLRKHPQTSCHGTSMLTLVAIRQPEERRLTPGPHTSAGRAGPQLTCHCRIRHSLIIDFGVMTVLDYTVLSLDYGLNRLKYFDSWKMSGGRRMVLAV